MMIKFVRFLLVGLLVCALFAVRWYGKSFFYDPFMDYFNGDYLVAQFPDFVFLDLIIDLAFRYSINTLISILIIGLAFKQRTVIVFSLKFYLIAFVLLALAYSYQLNHEFKNGYLIAFYVRRMLIHPMFLIILMPALYYHKKLNT